MNGESTGEVYRLKHFAKSAANQDNWFRSANSLVAAMKQLAPLIERYFDVLKAGDFEDLPEHDQHFTFLMLGGYAIENLCKGCLISQLKAVELEDLREKGDFPERLRKHKLGKYVADIGFPLTAVDKPLLERVESALLWRGRYPIPLRSADMTPSISMKGDVGRLFGMIDRLRHHVGACASRGPQPSK